MEHPLTMYQKWDMLTIRSTMEGSAANWHHYHVTGDVLPALSASGARSREEQITHDARIDDPRNYFGG